jgi:omega-amidase
MKVYCCQTDIAWEDKRANFGRVRRLLDSVAVVRGSLVVLPEMFATGFSMNAAAIAESAGGETERFLADTARDYGVWLIGGLPARGSDGRSRNEAVVFDPSASLTARYEKIFPFVFAEKDSYVAGDRTVSFDWGGFAVVLFICYDLRFPEIFRSATHGGANLIVVIANWPVARIGHWTTLLQARAIENQAYVVGVNRCGEDPTLKYSGQSAIIGPGGEILLEPWDGEGVRGADLDPAALRAYRESLPFLSSIRPEFIPNSNGPQ